MSNDKVDPWWTRKDVERASEAAWFYFKSQDGGNPNAHEALLAAMDALAPRVTEIVDRERRASKVEALREVAAEFYHDYPEVWDLITSRADGEAGGLRRQEATCPACKHAVSDHGGRWCRALRGGAVNRAGRQLICCCEAVDAGEYADELERGDR